MHWLVSGHGSRSFLFRCGGASELIGNEEISLVVTTTPGEVGPQVGQAVIAELALDRAQEIHELGTGNGDSDP